MKRSNTDHHCIYICALVYFYLGPAGVCSLFLPHFNSSSAMLRWDNAAGYFDFYKVTVSNSSHHSVFSVNNNTQEYIVSGLRDGCTYNATVERVRNRVSGLAASLTVHTGSYFILFNFNPGCNCFFFL